MKLIGYARVSTIGQATDGLGIPTQTRLIRAWAKSNKRRVVRVISENGRSGTLDETERPGLLEAINALRRGEADGIIVTSLDRLARALTVQEAVLGQVWRGGGRLFTVDGGEVGKDDPDDPMRTFVRQVMGAVSQLERGLIVKRLRNGRRTKAQAGGFAYGSPPYGWRAPLTPEERRAGKLVTVPDEQEALRLARKLERKGLSLRAIADELINAGHKPRRGKQWHPPGVRNLLRDRNNLSRI